MNRRGILFVISGPSGVGKGTIKNALLSVVDSLKLSVSVTTRPPRSGEVHSREYFFVSKEQFNQMIEGDEFLEWANVYSNLYGTPRYFVYENLKRGQDILLEIDIQGAMQVKEKIPEGVFIFISPPNLEELAERLCSRGKDSMSSINMRLAACEKEMKYIEYYDYVVVNDEIHLAVDKIKSIITAERCKVKNLIGGGQVDFSF
ncbi:MAG: guanylate kinase [Syntrophomonadaceae bacterium]|jgi:guanylate kinase